MDWKGPRGVFGESSGERHSLSSAHAGTTDSAVPGGRRHHRRHGDNECGRLPVGVCGVCEASYEVVNGACKYGDMEHFKKEMAKFQAEGKDVKMEYLGDIGLIAIQGAMAPTVLRRFTEVDVTKMPFMTGQDMKVGGVNCRVTRCGYTGEDGYEVQIPAADSIPLVKEILKNKEVVPCGLGARDSLRLEAGLCLYGTDLNTSVSPVEGTLMWTISKQRRADGGFIGHQAIMERVGAGRNIDCR